MDHKSFNICLCWDSFSAFSWIVYTDQAHIVQERRIIEKTVTILSIPLPPPQPYSLSLSLNEFMTLDIIFITHLQ